MTLTTPMTGAAPALRTSVGLLDACESALPARCRVVLIDPREERRSITMKFVAACEELDVVGVAGNLGEAESQIRNEQADVAIVEIQMPVTDGLATIRGLRDEFHDLRIIVCSFLADVATREAARVSGADGYLSKPLRVKELLGLIVFEDDRTSSA